MKLIDRVILEWSYKTKKGYPDINSQEDMDLFESMFGFDINEGDFNILTFGDLKKYGGPRLNKLYTLIDAGTAIELASGKEEQITFAKPEYAELFKNSDVEAIKQLGGSRVNTFPFFIDNSKNPLPINGLVKSVPFGGRGKGTGTEKENIALAGINQELNTSGPINVHVAGDTYKGITKATTVVGVPKADFTLDTENGPVIFLSHKDGTTPKHFQQYGGFKGFEEHKEIIAFVESVRTATNGALERKQSFKRALLSEEIKRKAVYGLGFGDKEFHKDNCQAILQGPVKFEEQESGDYTIICNHQVSNPDIPSGLYEPMLYVTFRSDRNNMGIKNARFGIYPADYKPNATDI